MKSILSILSDNEYVELINVRCLKFELDLYVINVNMISKYYVILEIQCCQITCLHVFSSVLWCPRKNDVRFVSTPIYLQNITQKTKDQATWTPLKTGSELGCSGRVDSSCSTCDTCPVTVKWQKHQLKWKSCWTPHITEY
jgi:hypothetical protein